MENGKKREWKKRETQAAPCTSSWIMQSVEWPTRFFKRDGPGASVRAPEVQSWWRCVYASVCVYRCVHAYAFNVFEPSGMAAHKIPAVFVVVISIVIQTARALASTIYHSSVSWTRRAEGGGSALRIYKPTPQNGKQIRNKRRRRKEEKKQETKHTKRKEQIEKRLSKSV